MNTGWAVNLALLVVVAALASFVVLKPHGDVPAQHRLTALKAVEVKHITLERRGDPPIVLERQGSAWMITAPLSARADPFQVERLLGILDATATHRFAAQDLARFDLDQALTQLTIDGIRFSYGAVNAVTREQYVLANDAVYAVPARYAAMIPAGIQNLIRKQLLAASESPVQFEFRDFKVGVEGKSWRVSPAPGELSQDDVLRWIDAWRHAAALWAEPYSATEPLETIKMELRDGKPLTLLVLQKSPEVIIARPDEKLRYHFAAETGKRLLAPPGSIH